VQYVYSKSGKAYSVVDRNAKEIRSHKMFQSEGEMGMKCSWCLRSVRRGRVLKVATADEIQSTSQEEMRRRRRLKVAIVDEIRSTDEEERRRRRKEQGEPVIVYA